MPLQTIWNASGSRSATFSQSAFITILLVIVIGWILVSLWTRFIENFAFGTLGLDEDGSWDTFLVALFITIFFIAFIWMVDQYDIVPGGLESDVSQGDALTRVSSGSNTASGLTPSAGDTFTRVNEEGQDEPFSFTDDPSAQKFFFNHHGNGRNGIGALAGAPGGRRG